MGSGITLEPEWNMVKAWTWLMEHRQQELIRWIKGPDDSLGPLMPTVLKNIELKCEPLFRLLEDRPGSTDF